MHAVPGRPSPHHAPSACTEALSCASYCDIDEQAAALSGWHQTYQQLTPGAFRGSMKRLDFGGVRLFVEDLRQSVFQTGCVDHDVIGLGVPHSFAGDALFCGERSDLDTLHVFSGRDGFEFRSPQVHVMLGIEIDEPFLAARPPGDEAAMLRFDRRAGPRAVQPGALDGLRRFLCDVFDAAAEHSVRLSTPEVRGALVDTLLDRLSQLMPLPSVDVVRGANARRQLVDRAQEIAATRLEQPPTVAELCDALGVSRRSLQYGFQEVWGVSPLSYLRVMRLNAARRTLKTAGSVTDAATQLGFWHFGHFARDYQAMFGELPSATFRRHHRGLTS
jgi:AraC family transcriptional regulator, ethanolamine operon transcriptional activator